MYSPNDKLEELKLKLRSATKLSIKNEMLENYFYTTERSMAKDVSLIKTEKEFMQQQLEDLKSQISQKKYRNTLINIWHDSEKTKIESQIINVNSHVENFNILCDKEREVLEMFNKELLKKEVEKVESERQKNTKLLESKEREITAIESECIDIKRECCILKKRNKAAMLQIRHKLIDAQTTRRLLMDKKGLVLDK